MTSTGLKQRVFERLRDERGESVIPMLLWAPVVVLLLMLGLYAGRVAGAEGEVQDAAQAGARAASIVREPGLAAAAAQQAIGAALPAGESVCESATVSINTGGWFGEPGFVEVTVTCTIRVSDLSGLPVGVQSVTKTWVEPVDLARVAVER